MKPGLKVQSSKVRKDEFPILNEKALTQRSDLPSLRVCSGNFAMTTAQLVTELPELGAARDTARANVCLSEVSHGSVEVRAEVRARPVLESDSEAQTALPRYQLTLEVPRGENPHTWRFTLHPSDGHRVLTVEDCEPNVTGEQLELLTLIRGLEALDQPSVVTAYGCSRFLRHGIVYGLPEWRENGWQWECFGQLVAIKHDELWQRLDRAMQIHRFTCGMRRVDASHGGSVGHPRFLKKTRRVGVCGGFANWIKYSTQMLLLAVARMIPQPG